MGPCSFSLLVWSITPVASVWGFHSPFGSATCGRALVHRQSTPSLNFHVKSGDMCKTIRSIFPHRRRRSPSLLNTQHGTEDGDNDGILARRTAEDMLRQLSERELESIKSRLGLHEKLEGEELIAQAVPILAAKIHARDEAHTAERGAKGKNRNPGGEDKDWGVGENGLENTLVSRSTQRERSRTPQERLLHPRRADRKLEPPLAPGERIYFATCPRGLETTLRDELLSSEIGASMVKTSGRGCHFRGNQAIGYQAILWLRTAHRVLELLGDSEKILGKPITDVNSLYEVAAAVPWAKYMREDETLSVDAILGVVPEGLTHSHFTALTVKNAVVDQFRGLEGQRPSVDTQDPHLPLVVYVDRGRVLLYRSLSGTRSMHKRGYREAMHAASLKENVAAGLLLASDWNPETQAIADPMCGSGTLLIEAALIAMRRAPGLVAMGAFCDPVSYGGARPSEVSWRPAISSWPDFNEELWRAKVEEALMAARPCPPESIMGNDWHHGALSLARRDAKAAGVEHCITLSDEDVARWHPPKAADIVVTNPPWDRRLDRDAEQSWESLLEFLRREVAERDAWVLSGNPVLSRILRMKSEQNMFVAIGEVELRWLKYHLNEYRGGDRRGKRGRGRGPQPRKVSRRFDRPAIDRW